MQTQTAPPLIFAGALLAMGMIFLLFPRSAGVLGVVLVLGALLSAEAAAKDQGIAGPLAELGLQVKKRGV